MTDSAVISTPFDIADSAIIQNSMDISGVIVLATELATAIDAFTTISNSLSFGLTGTCEICAPIGVCQNSTLLITELSEGIGGGVAVNNVIGDFAYMGGVEIVAEMPLSGLAGTIRIRNSIGGKGAVISQSCLMTINGDDITDRVSSATINLYGASAIADIEINLPLTANPFCTGEICRVQIETDVFEFIIEEFEQSQNSLKIWGRAKAAALYEPYTQKQAYSIKSGDAEQIAEAIDDSVYFIADSYTIGAMSGEMYPIEAVQKIAEAGGYDTRGLDDVFVVNPFDVQEFVSLDSVFEKTVTQTADIYDAVKVSLSGDDILIVDAEKTEAEINEIVNVRIYSTFEYTFKTEGVSNLRFKRQVRETVSEDIQLTSGAGSLKYPVIKMLTEGVTVAGQNIYAEGCRYISVSYETEYDLWHVWSDKAITALVCVAETENTVLIGAGEKVLTADNELVTTAETALIYGTNTLNSNKGKTAKFKIPYMPELATLEPTGIRHDDFQGVITALSVSIESNPLRIYQNIEAREYGN